MAIAIYYCSYPLLRHGFHRLLGERPQQLELKTLTVLLEHLECCVPHISPGTIGTIRLYVSEWKLYASDSII